MADPAQQRRPQLIVFAVMILLVLLLAVVGLFVGTEVEPESRGMLYLFIALAVLVTFVACGVPRWLKRSRTGTNGGAETARRVVSWALAILIGIFGFVLRFLGFGEDVLLTFVGWCLSILLANGPWMATFGRGQKTA